MSQRVRRAAALALLLPLAGCAGAGAYPAQPAPETLPANSPLLSRSLGRTDAWLRHYVMEGHPDSAVRMLDASSPLRPHDELVRQLQLGLVYHYAGKWEASNAAFEYAEGEAAARWSRSLTQQLGELVINDAVADYLPPAGEMALVPYYRMLNYLALGSEDGALVEARKASDWLARLHDGSGACVGDGFVHYLAGTAFRGAGERNDALVAYRSAERAFEACAGKDESRSPPWLGADLYRAALDAGVGEVADSAARRYRLTGLGPPAPQSGELVVVVENGWVAHRATAAVHLPIFSAEVEGVDGSDAGRLAEATARVLARLAGNLQQQAYWGEAWDDHPAAQLAAAASGAYVMRLAWPEYQLEAALAPRVQVLVDDQELDAPVADDVSAVMLRRWQAQRPAVFSRMVGRAIVKYAASHALESEARRKHGRTAGWITGRVTNLAGNALERADTRGWTLLPDRIGVARFTLPAGTHTVRLRLLDADGAEQTLELGSITLQPGGTLVLNRRVWGGEMGDVRGLYARAGPAETISAR